MTSSARPQAPATARRHLVTRSVLASGVGAVVALTLAACGGSSTAATNKSPSSGPSSSSSQTPRNPGVSGKIADVEGSTIQVQSTDTQTAVTFTAATTITAQQAATLADVTVGSCIVATAATSSDASSAAANPAATLAATTVQIRPATTVTPGASGSCELGGFGGGTRPSGAPSGRGFGNGPNGSATPPSASTSRRPGNGTRAAAAAIGEVVSVSGDTIVVNEVTFGGFRNGTSSTQPTPSASPSTRTRTITVSTSTTYSTTAKATSSALVVGKCATAQGTADSTGTVAATAIEVTDPVNGACNGTLVRRFGGQGGGSNSTGGGATQNGTSGA